LLTVIAAVGALGMVPHVLAGAAAHSQWTRARRARRLGLARVPGGAGMGSVSAGEFAAAAI